jgi:3-methyladenine DNA glycosylase Tag
MKDLRTMKQKERDKRDAAICKAYSTLRRQQPLVSRNRVLAVVAEEYNVAGMTVKNILRKNDAYN